MIAILSAALVAAQPAKPQSHAELVNLVPAFDRFHQLIAPLPEITPGAALRAHFAPKIGGFYTVERGGEDIDGRIEGALEEWPEKREVILAVADRFEAEFNPALVAFEAEFGALEGEHQVYLVHSLGEFDGAVRGLDRGPTLLFGADVIERIHGENRLAPLFVHEFFHGYHGMTWDGCNAIACSLWSEGLAVHVVRTLFPEASDGELLLTIPRPIPQEVDDNLPLAACSALALLDGTDGYRDLFSFGNAESGLPPRYGYYLGELVAREIGKNRSLAQLAAMDSATVRPLIEATLTDIGKGCAD